MTAMRHPRLMLLARLSPSTVNYAGNGGGGQVLTKPEIAGCLAGLPAMTMSYVEFVFQGERNAFGELQMALAFALIEDSSDFHSLAFVDLLGLIKHVLIVMQSELCPKCNGDGRVPKLKQRVKTENGKKVKVDVVELQTCPACDGTGSNRVSNREWELRTGIGRRRRASMEQYERFIVSYVLNFELKIADKLKM